MSATIEVDAFRSGLLIVLGEIFETSQGYVLDPNESMLETLGTIDAAAASRRADPGGSSIAAQVNHVVFLIDSVLRNREQELNWASSWDVPAVNDAEWQLLVDRLRGRYAELRSFATSFDGWDASFVGGAFALVAHCAYHLGQVRAALGGSAAADAG